MKLRKAIRAKLGHMHFMKELKKVQFKRDVVGFNEAGKIGLLYDATDEKDYEVVKAYVKNVRGNLKKDILAMGYVDKKVLPHFDFLHMTALALGKDWRKATPQQQQQLTTEFKTLLVRTYSNALTGYKNQKVVYKPFKMKKKRAAGRFMT